VVYEIRRSATFDTWLMNLNDSNARARIAARIDYGPGYRVYYAQSDRVVFLLLCGGTKATQDADIKRAVEMNTVRARQASAARRQKPRKGK